MGTANPTPSNYTFPLLVAALTTWVRCVTLWVTRVPIGCHMQRKSAIVQLSFRLAKELWSGLPQVSLQRLEELIEAHGLSVASGDLLYLHGGWYVTHTGLLRLARRRHCCGKRGRLGRGAPAILLQGHFLKPPAAQFIGAWQP